MESLPPPATLPQRAAEAGWWRGGGWRWMVASLGIVAVLAVGDLTTDGVSVLVGLLVAGPFLASTVVGFRETAVVAACAVAVAALLMLRVLEPTSGAYWARVGGVAAVSALAVGAAHSRTLRLRDLVRLRSAVDAAEEAIFLPVEPRVGSFEIAVRHQSASEESRLGGDAYDVVSSPFGIRLLIADVKGSGLEAVRLAALVLARFREAAFGVADVTEVVRALSAGMSRHLEPEDFVTLIVVELRPEGLTVVNCGHPPPLRVRPGLGCEPLEVPHSCPPIGIPISPAPCHFSWRPGDKLVLYTDGLAEARDGAGRFFPLEEQVEIHLGGTAPLDAALDALMTAAGDHARGPIGDDVTLIAVENAP